MSESQGPVTVISSVAEFEFRSLLGTEELGQPFRYEVELLNRSATVPAEKVLGSTMSIELKQRDGSLRYFHGYVTDFSLSGIAGELVVYSVTLRPWLHLLAHRTRCRIYKGTALEIVKEIANAEEYKGHSVIEEGMLERENLPTYEFVVQFRESDFDFLMRVLERDGIYYYFEHTKEQHKLKLTNDGGYDVAKYSEILYRPPSTNSTEVQESIDGWHAHHSLTVGKLTSREFSYKAPSVDLLARAEVTPKQAIPHLEVYDYPAGFFESGKGEPLAARRLETLQVRNVRYEGTSNVRMIGAGMVFSLAEHPFKAFNMQYLIYAAQFQIVSHASTSVSNINPGGDVMRVSFIALERARPFHPTPRTPKPTMPGVQSAIVVGESPGGEEVFLDDKEYTRVKVRFPWDPDPDKTGKNSCWVRVSQGWAGAGFGVQFHPRLGQEVLVGFLEGDPDRPIIVGRVYNYENRPPYPSPTLSGIKTDSTIDENHSDFNEIRFEDKAGQEELFVQAQKTHTVKVKGNRSVTVGGTETIEITKKETRTYKDTRETTIEKGTDKLHVMAGLRTSIFDQGRDETVNNKQDKLAVTAADGKLINVTNAFSIQTGTGLSMADEGGTSKVLLGGSGQAGAPGHILMEAATGIIIKVGDSKIEITADGIAIDGTMVVVTGNKTNSLDLAGSTAKLLGASEVIVTGPVGIKLNC